MLGVAAVSLPVLLYFAVNGAVEDLLRVYFYDNMFLYSDSVSNQSFTVKILSMFNTIFKSLIEVAKKNILPAILILSGLMHELIKDGRKMFANYLVLTVFTALFIFGGGRHYDYYALPLCIFSLHGFIFGAEKAEAFLNKKGKDIVKISAVFSFILSTVLSLLICPNVRSMLVPKELARYKFREIINETKNQHCSITELLTTAFYRLQHRSNCKYFCNLNLPS